MKINKEPPVPIRNFLKKIASRLPTRWQKELKRLHFTREINKGRFRTNEVEYDMLEEWVSTGDWVLDIGANIGHYTYRLSELVGASGRVIAFEPVPETFELLAANISRPSCRNVTLLNMAASDHEALVGMTIPKFDTGLDNYYMAQITTEDSSFEVMAMPIDDLNLWQQITFAKIDAEGHELAVLVGMSKLIERDRPILVVEDNSPQIKQFLREFDYSSRAIQTSSNRIFEPN